VPRNHVGPPTGAATTTVEIRVPFFDTDGMRIVHHANYVKYLELARVRLLDEHHRPYTEYVAEGLHFAVTRVELDYHQAARFDDRIGATAWLRWVRGASLAVGYVIARGDEVLVSGGTEHALVDEQGRPRRIPKPHRAELAGLVAPEPG
jgi:acyl-CoA thioester hydrolase